MEQKINADSSLVAYCGLYCGACTRFLRGKCSGCSKNEKATWCKVRSCCHGRGYKSCAECKDFDSTKECRKFNNIISRIFGVIFRSDRSACIRRIKEIGLEEFSREMALRGRHSIPR